MTDKCCNNCVFYKDKQEAVTPGTCDYPVPDWIKIGTSGGGFIMNPKFSGESCSTFKSRADIVHAAKYDLLCNHNWVSADNEVVKGGLICTNCNNVKAK